VPRTQIVQMQGSRGDSPSCPSSRPPTMRQVNSRNVCCNQGRVGKVAKARVMGEPWLKVVKRWAGLNIMKHSPQS
jgi:hypothetical protein